MGAARRITISLPAETAQAVDEAAMQRGCSRSELIKEALVWHLRVQTLPIEEPTRRSGRRLRPVVLSMLVANS